MFDHKAMNEQKLIEMHAIRGSGDTIKTDMKDRQIFRRKLVKNMESILPFTVCSDLSLTCFALFFRTEAELSIRLHSLTSVTVYLSPPP